MFLREILAELDQVKEVSQNSPAVEAGEEEEVLGVLDRDLQRLFILTERADWEVEKLQKQQLLFQAQTFTRGGNLTDEQQEITDQIRSALNRAVMRYKVLHTLFWTSIRISMPKAAEVCCLHLRKGFKVTSGGELPNAQSLLASLLGW